MAWRLDLSGLFASPAFWWMDAMVLLWALFMLIVFVIEPPDGAEDRDDRRWRARARWTRGTGG